MENNPNNNQASLERNELHNTIWKVANELRGSVDGWDFKPPKQKSQISLVFGMNALVPLGTIKTL